MKKRPSAAYKGTACPHCKSTNTSPENREETRHYCYNCRKFFTKGARS